MTNPTTYYERPEPPDSTGDWLTLRELAAKWGLSKGTVRRYIDDQIKPLPYTRNADGIVFVLADDADEYLEKNPERGAAQPKVITRTPVEPDAPAGHYLTLAEAAEATGYTRSAVRSWTRRSRLPLAVYHNSDGYLLVYKHDLTAFMDAIDDPDVQAAASSKKPPSPSPAPPAQTFKYYPELEAIKSTYISVVQASDAIGISERNIRKWIHKQDDPLPVVMNGRQALINKHRLAEYLERLEQEQVA